MFMFALCPPFFVLSLSVQVMGGLIDVVSLLGGPRALATERIPPLRPGRPTRRFRLPHVLPFHSDCVRGQQQRCGDGCARRRLGRDGRVDCGRHGPPAVGVPARHPRQRHRCSLSASKLAPLRHGHAHRAIGRRRGRPGLRRRRVAAAAVSLPFPRRCRRARA